MVVDGEMEAFEKSTLLSLRSQQNPTRSSMSLAFRTKTQEVQSGSPNNFATRRNIHPVHRERTIKQPSKIREQNFTSFDEVAALERRTVICRLVRLVR